MIEPFGTFAPAFFPALNSLTPSFFDCLTSASLSAFALSDLTFFLSIIFFFSSGVICFFINSSSLEATPFLLLLSRAICLPRVGFGLIILFLLSMVYPLSLINLTRPSKLSPFGIVILDSLL